MASRGYKEVKIVSIDDIRVGDIMFFDDGCFGLVIKRGTTILHRHVFIKVINLHPTEKHLQKWKFYEEDFNEEEDIVLRDCVSVEAEK